MSAKILVRSAEDIVEEIQIPTNYGSFFTQQVEYVGLLNQCYYCNNICHLVVACPKSIAKAENKSKDPDPSINQMSNHDMASNVEDKVIDLHTQKEYTHSERGHSVEVVKENSNFHDRLRVEEQVKEMELQLVKSKHPSPLKGREVV